MTGTERGRILRRAADILRARNDELAELETLDTGKPIQETIVVDVDLRAPTASSISPGSPPRSTGEHVDLGASAFGYTRREPLGVVAGIGAWNYPLQIACWKSAPALACGNAMIFKPAELTPLTALKLAEIYRRSGPAGRRVQRRAGRRRHRPRCSTRHPASPRCRSPARSAPASSGDGRRRARR